MPSREVTIRMYRQGLGDCFLLTFPRTRKPCHMLIDCGALVSRHYDARLMKKVVADIEARTKGHVDVVVGTHEHWDHISGFLDAENEFKRITVGEVWVGWTEDPTSEAARTIKAEFKKRKRAVEMALARIPEAKQNKQLGLYKQAIGELFGFYGPLGAKGGMGRTERAWANLLKMGRNVYCDPKTAPLKLDGVADVRVYVLGPPEDPDFIRKKVSAKETYQAGLRGLSLFDSFLAAVSTDAADLEMRERAFPVDARYQIPPATARSRPFFREHYGFAAGDFGAAWRRIDDDWLLLAGELALHLDSYTNNTCLALAIELGETGKVLLFPGDAQVGNWLSWAERSWKVKTSKGEMRTVTSDDLLARTVLYKVGHHGSHNATLRARGLEKMESPDLVAMIPVHRSTARDQEWEFPYRPLWKRLNQRACGRVLLADQKSFEDLDEPQTRMSASEWTAFRKRTTFTDLCIEHRISY
jgi:hypothetical protein